MELDLPGMSASATVREGRVPSRPTRLAVGFPCCRWSAASGREQRPDQRYYQCCGRPHDQVHRHADTYEVDELVPPRTVDEGIRLIPDRGGEAGAGGEHDGDNEGPRVGTQLQGDTDGNGSQQDTHRIVADDFGQDRGQ